MTKREESKKNEETVAKRQFNDRWGDVIVDNLISLIFDRMSEQFVCTKHNYFSRNLNLNTE